MERADSESASEIGSRPSEMGSRETGGADCERAEEMRETCDARDARSRPSSEPEGGAIRLLISASSSVSDGASDDLSACAAAVAA